MESVRRSGHATGMAGEFFVMEKLFRLGHEPALTLGNAKSVDILVRTSGGKTLEVSVKAIRGGGKWGVETDDVSARKNLVFVFLHYRDFEEPTSSPDVFVVPAKQVEALKAPWLNGGAAVYCSNGECRSRLEPYKDRWDLIA